MSFKKQQLLVLIRCCICLGCSIGITANCFGLFYTPMSEALGVGRRQVAMIITFRGLAQAFAAPRAAKLLRKVPVSAVLTAGVLLSAGSVLIMAFSSNLDVLYAAGILLGCGMCCCSTLPISMIIRNWYGENNAAKLGIAMGCTGIFAAVFNVILGAVITARGYREGFITMAAVVLAFCLPCSLTVRLREDTGNAPAGKRPAASSGKGTAAAAAASGVFLFLLTGVFMGMQTGLNTHMSSIIVSAGYTLQFSAMALSCHSICNSLLKVVFGYTAERLGAVKTGMIYESLACLGYLLILLCSGTPFLLVAGVSLFSAVFSYNTVGVPTLMQHVYGDAYLDHYAKVTLTVSLVYAGMNTIYGGLFDATGGYLPQLSMAACAAFANVILVLLISRRVQGAQSGQGE